jgi:hypothetical protein
MAHPANFNFDVQIPVIDILQRPATNRTGLIAFSHRLLLGDVLSTGVSDLIRGIYKQDQADSNVLKLRWIHIRQQHVMGTGKVVYMDYF